MMPDEQEPDPQPMPSVTWDIRHEGLSAWAIPKFGEPRYATWDDPGAGPA
jgi:hypothetical protein